MQFVKGMKCRECGKKYPHEPLYVCEFCFGPLEVDYDYEAIKKQLHRRKIKRRARNLWRYRELLPLNSRPRGALNTGYTPLIRARNLQKKLNVKELYIKNDAVCHPTLSFKDRVVAVALEKAREFGFRTVACASTGNLANAVAAQSAAANLKSLVFIPADLEEGKIVGSLIYHPSLIGVEGNYDEVNRLCSELAGRYQWAFVNINIRPYYAEGSKTFGFETIEQLGWKAPQHVVVPCAGGSLISKIDKAIEEFQKIGLTEKADTRIHAAQAAGCSPIVDAIKNKTETIKPVKPRTIAKSLAIGNPADGPFAVRTVQKTKGWGEQVSDEEIIEAAELLASSEGIFTETAGGVTMATTIKLIEKGIIPRDESILVSITGNGLKTQEAFTGGFGETLTIQPTIQSFEEHYLTNQ